jgi:hypothetical protein
MMVKHRIGHFLHRRDDVRWKHDPGVWSEFCGVNLCALGLPVSGTSTSEFVTRMQFLPRPLVTASFLMTGALLMASLLSNENLGYRNRFTSGIVA